MFGAEFESSWLNPDSSTKRNPNQRKPLHRKRKRGYGSLDRTHTDDFETSFAI